MYNLRYKLKQLWLFILAKIKMNQWLIKIISIIFGVIVILLILAIGFLYFNFYFKKDRLIRYVPKEAVLYAAFYTNRFEDNNLINNFLNLLKQKYEIANLDPSYLNHLVRYNVALAIIPKSDDNFYNFDYLLLFDLGTRPEEDWLKKGGLNYTYLENDFLNKNILAVSNSPAIIEKAISVRNQEADSLLQRISVTINLEKINWGDAGKLYIDTENFSRHLGQLNELRLKLPLLFLQKEGIDGLYFGIARNDQKVILSNFRSDGSSAQSLLNQIPSGYQYSLNFKAGNNILLKALYLLNQIDPDYYRQILKNIEYSQGILNLDWQSDILPFFNDQAQIIAYPGNKYLVAIKVDEIANLNQKLSKLEEIISNTFTVEGSREQEKRLVDGTYITQIVRLKTKQFEDLDKNNQQIRILKNQNIEFGYFLAENKLILANSVDLLRSLAEQNGLVELPNNKMANLGTNLAINGQFLNNSLNFANILNNIIISEENGKILLIIE
jgi:hypothetical protein